MKPADPMALIRKDKRFSAPKSICTGCHRLLWTYDQEYCSQCARWIAEHPGVPLADSTGRAQRARQERATDTSWKEQAACRSADPALFEAPEDGQVTNYSYRRYREVVRTYCFDCPVMAECGEEASRLEYEGLFGGELRVFDKDGVPRICRFTHRGGGGIRWVELARASS